MPATVAALRPIIDFYRQRGYVFVDLTGTTAERQVAGDWDGNGRGTPGVVRGQHLVPAQQQHDRCRRRGLPYGDPPTYRSSATGTATARPPGVWRAAPSTCATATPRCGGHRRPLRRPRRTCPSSATGTATAPSPRGSCGDRHLVPAQQQQHRRGRRGCRATATPRTYPLAGDWDGNGTTRRACAPGTPIPAQQKRTGVADVGARLTATPGGPPARRSTGTATERPRRGSPAGNTWYLRNSNSSGVADLTLIYGG